MSRPPHPTDGIEIHNRELRGPHSRGVPAADIGTAQGADGRWYARWCYMTPTGGEATPIGHSVPHQTEADALAWAAGRINVKAQRVALHTGDHFTETDKTWARKIVAWADQFLLGQGDLGL